MKPLRISYTSPVPGARRVRRFSSPGFTLTELIVAIGLIAILVAIIIPAINDALVNSRNSRCINNLRGLGLAMKQYLGEHRGVGPPNYGGAMGNGTYLWTGYLAPYLGVEVTPTTPLSTIFDCPIDADSKQRPSGRTYVSIAASWSISYGYNFQYVGESGVEPRVNLNTIAQPSMLILFADAPGLTEGGSLYCLIDCINNIPSRTASQRHRKGFNAVFADGHVQWMPYTSTVNNGQYWRPQ